MSWVQTYSRRAVDLLLPDASTIFLPDIAFQTARLPRFSGATFGAVAYSVAQHAHWCEQSLPPGTPPEIRLSVLLHDAHEAYTGDITTPVKQAMPVGFAYALRMIQARLDVAIREAIGLPWDFETPGATMLADRKALAIERRDVMPGGDRDWQTSLSELPVETPALQPLQPWAAAHVFILRVRQLVAEAGLKPLSSFGLFGA